MADAPVFLQLALPESVDGKVPTDVRLLARGETDTTKGKYRYTDRSEAAILKRVAELGRDRLNFDYGHAQLSPFQSADASASAGWFRLDAREDGLYAADIEWTPRASKGLSEREWRYFSPAIMLDAKSGEVLELINVALTNIPATKGQRPLVASQTPGDGPQPKETMEEMAKLLVALGASDASQAVAKFSALQKSHDDLVEAAKVQAAELESVKAEIKKFHDAKAEAAKAEAVAKLPPAFRQWALSQSIEVIESFAAVAPKAPEAVQPPAKAGAAAKSEEHSKVSRLLGLVAEDEVSEDGKVLQLSWGALPKKEAK